MHASREQALQLYEQLTTDLVSEFKILKDSISSPVSFIQAMYANAPQPVITLEQWAFFASIFDWDSAFNFRTDEKFDAFRASITRVAFVHPSDLPQSSSLAPPLFTPTGSPAPSLSEEPVAGPSGAVRSRAVSPVDDPLNTGTSAEA
jgi:hypothetical protein